MRGSVYELPSNSRVGAIAFDGAVDLRLWRGPGTDRDLMLLWGDELQGALDTERTKLGIEKLEFGQVVRIHPGRLHADFLAWVGTRIPETGTERMPAPDAALLKRAVMGVLNFVAERNVKRIGFPALGGGPGELPKDERLEIIVRTAHEYEENCFKEGRPPVVEQVLVCEPLGSVVAAAQRRVARLAKQVVATPKASASSTPAKRKTRTSSTRKSTKKPGLDPDLLAKARATAPKYAMTETYAAEDWLNHKKFGVGMVAEASAEGWIMVLFEDGTQRRMVHGRS